MPKRTKRNVANRTNRPRSSVNENRRLKKSCDHNSNRNSSNNNNNNNRPKRSRLMRHIDQERLVEPVSEVTGKWNDLREVSRVGVDLQLLRMTNLGEERKEGIINLSKLQKSMY